MTPTISWWMRGAGGFCLIATAIGTLSSPRWPNALIAWAQPDLILHFLAYLMMALVILPFVRRPGWIAVGLSGLAVVGEVAQALLTTNRSPQVMDAVFGVAGVLVVFVTGETLCWWAVRKKNRR